MARYKVLFSNCPLLVCLFSSHSILITCILLAQQVSFTQGKNEQLNFLKNKLVGSITAKDWDLILERNGTNKNRFESIFQTFPRLLVPYEEINRNTQSESILSQILNFAPLTNAKIQYSGTNESHGTPKEELIEVWISYSPLQGNISKDTEHIVSAVTQANSRFDETATAMLLDYSGQNFSEFSLQIKEDIRIATPYVSQLEAHSKENFTFGFGIILDLHNCQQNHAEQIEQEMSMVNMLVFKDIPSPSPSQEIYEECRRKYEATQLRIGFITPWSASISQDSNFLQLSLENKAGIRSYTSWQKSTNVTLILEADLLNKTRPGNDTTGKDDKMRNTTSQPNINYLWLRSPVVFDKPYFGMTVANHVLNHNRTNQTRLIFSIKEVTRRIIIGDVSVDTKLYKNPTIRFIKQLAESKVKNVRNKSLSGSTDIFEDHGQMRIYISSIISHESINTSEKAIDEAVDIAVEGNDVFPDTVAGVTLNCEDYPVENDVIAGSSITTEESHWFKFIAPSIKYAKSKLPGSSKLDIGIALPDQFCKYFTSTNASYPNLNLIKVIFFKKNIGPEDFQPDVRELVGQLATDFQQCKRNAERQQSPEKKDIRVEFQVKPTGCKANYSDTEGLMFLANLVRLWEGMNNWAMKEKIVVTMDTAFNDKSSKEYCGWWEIIPAKGNLTFENKKQTALKLYKTLFPDVSAPEKSDHLLLTIILSITVFVIFLSSAASLFVVRYRSRYILGKGEADDFFKGMDDKDKTEDEPLNSAKDGNKTAFSQPYDKERLEIPKGNFILDKERSLGSGEFGMVCKGSIKKRIAGEEEKEMEVAVKMINDKQGNSQGCNRALKGLMSEIKILSYVGEHNHIISLEGAYTAELRRGRVYVFLELCQMGSLDKHLRSFENSNLDKDKNAEGNLPSLDNTVAQNSQNGDPYANVNKKNVLDDALARDLFQWSKEICCGMEYLATKNVVHADLATRNVLLNYKKCSKIADFGLSRRLYDYTNYVKKQQEPMPWRWMAPESLKRLEFNEKTDVWAFGVTLWEIYTLGDQPYPGLSWDVNFVNHLERGLRLSEPRFKEPDMCKIMQSCWETDSDCRPSFSVLSASLMETVNQARYGNEIISE